MLGKLQANSKSETGREEIFFLVSSLFFPIQKKTKEEEDEERTE